ncbi:MAG: nucleoside triphosphate pyrophosphohydrolase [Bacteroidales bacterium]|jgi:XTP/dITP diphosphohydrolase|nr:nucleoside triphosphate pyrophosphohydrolase [Bacteroidales bacterium]
MKHQKAIEKFGELLEIMDRLRAECPWDREQTNESLRHLTIEETYELSDALLSKNPKAICGELGDLMLHIVFYAKIGSETNSFDIADVLDGINRKLINRHPHIFGNVQVNSAEEVADNWEKIKLEKEGKKSVLEGVPKSLPPLVKAYRMQEKVSGVGFDWENRTQVWDKVLEELRELEYEVEQGADPERLESEFGDLLFALVNYARFININPEDALEKTNRKFLRRFAYIEKKAEENGFRLSEMDLAQMDAYWEESKKEE